MTAIRSSLWRRHVGDGEVSIPTRRCTDVPESFASLKNSAASSPPAALDLLNQVRVRAALEVLPSFVTTVSNHATARRVGLREPRRRSSQPCVVQHDLRPPRRACRRHDDTGTRCSPYLRDAGVEERRTYRHRERTPRSRVAVGHARPVLPRDAPDVERLCRCRGPSNLARPYVIGIIDESTPWLTTDRTRVFTHLRS